MVIELISGSAFEPEIQVTPAMIAAGVAALLDYDPAFSNEDEIVEKIFRSMLANIALRPPPLRGLHLESSSTFPPTP
jgi:hypothetical protein